MKTLVKQFVAFLAMILVSLSVFSQKAEAQGAVSIDRVASRLRPQAAPRELYHVTSEANEASILQRGLLRGPSRWVSVNMSP
jgi:RNA:NAD 2'-phosphotransferase (TPT1/KptA family)